MAAAPVVLKGADKKIPVGLELYSVRDELKKNDFSTLERVAKMGYEVVEFFAPYYDWTTDHARDIKKKLDDTGLRCFSTHNGRTNFDETKLQKAIELNQILGARWVVMSHPGDNMRTVDDWKQVAEVLNHANSQLGKAGMHAGYHNHDLEWKPVDGQLPMEILADNTEKSVMLQLDVGTCVASGRDPVAWVDRNPGRIRSMHLKDWAPEKGYRVLFGEGVVPWKKLFAAAETTGGVEYYLIEQEGADYPEFETADRCLIAYKHIHG